MSRYAYNFATLIIYQLKTTEAKLFEPKYGQGIQKVEIFPAIIRSGGFERTNSPLCKYFWRFPHSVYPANYQTLPKTPQGLRYKNIVLILILIFFDEANETTKTNEKNSTLLSKNENIFISI